VPDEPNPPNPPEGQPEPPAQGYDPDATPFESPSYETVEKGLNGPWEKPADDD
jgi:hypothetical protein